MVAAMALVALAVPAAVAQVPAHNAAAFTKAYAQVVDVFGGQEKFQASYEEARAEQARVEGALQLSLNLEARFRANNSTKAADIYLNAANGLRPVIETLRVTFAKFDALDTPLDEARAKAAHDRIAAELAVVLQRPLTEQYEFSKTHTLTEEPLGAIQAAVGTLIAVAEKKQT